MPLSAAAANVAATSFGSAGTNRAFIRCMPGFFSSGFRNRDRERLLAHKRILIVDDEDDPRELLGLILASRGVQVSEASSVQEALDALKGARFDAIISDLGMPERDGYCLIENIRAQPEFANLPALALTAFTGAEAHTRGLAAGFDSYMHKPFDADELLDVIASLIQKGRTSASGF